MVVQMCVLWLLASSTGIIRFSEVKSFLKKQHDQSIKYNSIHTKSRIITLSGSHLIFAKKHDMEVFNAMYVGYFFAPCGYVKSDVICKLNFKPKTEYLIANYV